ncbi:DUF1924 domain-containing protein [Terasakiella sp. A23]|uniref:DUF1924 domain-containing protein n=1 Tax=Terasakiella sp. FCG-A23 TaxID=3080561 RepID=UPI0029555059|nr:DUF1924 domain-containing protein [Terasakiella sp. A23]MDV7340923.1 DUF1924 domain-containing protein [Terasakiella sp. A23]
MRFAEKEENALQYIKVWDLPLRIFHWTMVIVVSTTAITGFFFEDLFLTLHVYAGYTLGVLILFRLIWGVMGSYYSRFATFPLCLGDLKSQLDDLKQMKSPAYKGHNPVGAWMIVSLLGCLTLLSLSGLGVYASEENAGPLADLIPASQGEFFEETHEVLANLLMILVTIHIFGVLVESLVFKHPVVQAMITGRKRFATRSLLFIAALSMNLLVTTSTNMATANETQLPLLGIYAEQAKKDLASFDGFSAERGQRFFMEKHNSGNPETASCTFCHSSDPKKPGSTRAGKVIAPLALSVNPERYLDFNKAEKWFRRNCNSVLGRPCTALEKGDFITFMTTQ